MLAPRLKLHIDEGAALALAQYRVGEGGLLAVAARLVISPHDVYLPGHWRHEMLQAARLGPGSRKRHNQVVLVDLVPLQHGRHALGRLGGLGEDHEPAGRAV